MRFFHCLDAVCLFVVAAFILLETDAQPKTSNTKLKNKGPTSSGNAKPNADASSKTSASNTKLENEPAEQKNPDASPITPASLELTLGNHWNSKPDSCHADLTLSEHVQLSDSTPSEPVQQPSDPKLSKSKGLMVVKYNDKGKAKLTQRNSDTNEHPPPHLTLSEPKEQPSDSTPSEPKRYLVVKHKTGQSNFRSSVFAVEPIPKTSSGIFYYEVAILGKAKISFVSIGLGTKKMPLDKEIGDFEGTYAYQGCGLLAGPKALGCEACKAHGCKACTVQGYISYEKRDHFKKEFEGIRAGNVIGCGVDFKNKKIFYTLNGERMGPAGKFVASDDDLFPCVTLSKEGDEIEANFGPDFKFKNLLKWDEIVN